MHSELAGYVRLRLLVVVRDYDDELVSRDLAQSLHDALGRRAVEVACRLVRNDDRRVLGKSSRDRDPLLLPAREPRHLGSPVLREADQIDEFEYARLAFLLFFAGQKHHDLDILVDRVAVYQVEILKDISNEGLSVDLIILGAVGGGVLPAYEHLALFIAVESADNIEEGRLTASALSGYGYEFAYVEVKVYARKAHADGVFTRIVF